METFGRIYGALVESVEPFGRIREIFVQGSGFRGLGFRV